MTHQDLKDFLDEKVVLYNNPKFIEADPIQIPHQFSKKEDIEIIGLLVALIAWGNRKSIITNGNKLTDIMGGEPHKFVLDYDSNYLKEIRFVHRTFNTIDLDFILRALKNVYQNNAKSYFTGSSGSILRNFFMSSSSVSQSF